MGDVEPNPETPERPAGSVPEPASTPEPVSAPEPVSPAEPAPTSGTSLASFAGGLMNLLGSYGLAVGLLAVLLVITFLGTLEQRHQGIYDVQKQYFESWFHVSRTLGATMDKPTSGFPIPLPGAMPVLMLLAMNLAVGGIVRLRKGSSTVGILVTHLGIAALLLGGLVEFMFSREGTMTIRPGQSNGSYVSYHDWDVVVSEFLEPKTNHSGETTTPGREFVIEQATYAGLSSGEKRRFQHPDLPFHIDFSGYRRNCRPVRVGAASGMGDIEGWLLHEQKPEMKAEQNTPGVIATLVDVAPEGIARQGTKHVVLWGLTTGPYLFEWQGRRFGIDMQRQRYEIPFRIRLERFEKVDHPGITMAREYSSYVQMVEDGAVQDVHITMNEPLRHRGYIMYQSSYDPIGRDADGRTVYATVLAVSENPADRVPLWACVIIALGLLIHFCMKLYKHITVESRRQARATAD